MRSSQIKRVDAALDVIRSGGMVLVRDDEGRENEGDIVAAAELVTSEIITFMAVRGRGLICQAITEEIANKLDLQPQVIRNTDSHGTAFTISVDAAEGITTGISAADRALTARVLIDPASRSEDLCRPGHLFPLVACKGGVFERKGHTEAAVDLSRLAGLIPSGVICEVMQDDGTMARGRQLEDLSHQWGMPLISVLDLVVYREAVGDIPLQESSAADLPTEYGHFSLRVFHTGDPAAGEIVLLEAPGRVPASVPLVRLHSECLTGEVLGSQRCDCGPQLKEALRCVQEEGGAVLYLRQEGRGIGLFEKVKAYALQDGGLDTLEANLALGHEVDSRRYGAAASVLKQAGFKRIRLMTNNPEKLASMECAGIEVAERVPLHVGLTRENKDYLLTKSSRMGHFKPETTD